MKRNYKRILSAVLACVMIFALLPTSAFAADGDTTGTSAPDQVTGDINGYMAGLTADADTKDGYQNAFTVASGSEGAVSIDGTYRSSALNGKIWADKSVTANTANGTFGVTLSTLGQTFASTTTTTTGVAYDVVFVVDVSRSMTFGMSSSSNSAASPVSDSRMAKTVNVLNDALDKLFANGNPAGNRIAVVTFNNTATEFVPLGSYEKASGSNVYFTYEAGSTKSNTVGYYGTLKFNSSTASAGSTDNVINGTDQQAGLFKAEEVFKDAVKPTGSTIERVPVVIMITDGAPSDSALSNYKTGKNNDGSASASRVTDSDQYYTICTAAYTKDQIGVNYTTLNSKQTSAKFYTIGLGLAENTKDNNGVVTSYSSNHIMLDPSQRDLTATNSQYNNYNWTLSGTINYNSASTMGFSNYNYADASYVGEMTDEQLQKIFNEIMETVTSDPERVEVGESTGNRNKMTFFDTLGEGVRLDGNFTLEVPTYTTKEGKMVKSATRTYTLAPFTSADATDATESITGEAALQHVADGRTLYLKPVSVTVNETKSKLDFTNAYDKAAWEEFVFTVQKQESTNQRQIQASIPPALMAYNVLSSTTTNDTTDYTYYESDPVQLHYDVAMMDGCGAGSYLISAPTQSYLHFNPSSQKVKDAEGKDTNEYVMPYYWTGKGTNAGDAQNKNSNATGSDAYVYNTVWGANNDVSIYLGNNGLYTLTGKNLTFNLYWDDNDNVDGQRFENIPVILYRQALSGSNPAAPTTAPSEDDDNIEVVTDAAVTLGLSNVPGDDANLWTYTWADQEVYDDNGNYYRYWLRFDMTAYSLNGQNDDHGYDVSLYQASGLGYYPETGQPAENSGNSEWFGFQTENKDGNLTGNSNLSLKFSREQEKVDYTIEKVWVGTTAASVTVQLLVDGKPASQVIALGEGVSDTVTLTKGNADTDNPNLWTYTWTGLPKNRDTGSRVPYRAVETAVLDTTSADISSQYQTEYTYDGGGNTVADADLYTKTTVTNTYGSTFMTFMARVIWEDSDNQDGTRPESVPLKLVPYVNGAEITEDTYNTLFGGIEMTQNANAAAESGSAWVVSWSNIPRYSGSDPITYQVVQLDGTAELAKGSTYYTKAGDEDSKYTVTDYTSYGDAYMAVVNEHTTATVSITVNKTWEDNNNQDGLRPTSGFSGTLYKQVNNGTITPYFAFSSENGANSVQINGLPKYAVGEVGKTITYYVSEDAVNGYTLTNTGSVKASDGTDVYPVSNGSITLTNKHEPADVDYEVNFEWKDSNPNLRPTEIQLRMVGSYTDADGTTHETENFIYLNVVNGTISSVNEEKTTLPAGVTATVDSNGNLSIHDLPQYDDGHLMVYSVRVVNSGSYDATMDDYTLTSNDFTLSYEVPPITLTVTKIWSDTTDDAVYSQFRPAISRYALGLQLYANNELVTVNDTTIAKAPDSVTVDADGNWVFAWNEMDVYDDNGTAISYQVQETNVPNGYFTTGTNVVTKANFDENGSATLSNVFDPNSDVTKYNSITVTKIWNDSSNINGLRPEIVNGADPLGVKLYNVADKGNENAVGLEPATVTANADNTWTYTWNNVPKYDAQGNKITYAAYETTPNTTNYNVTVQYVDVIDGEQRGEGIINTLKSGVSADGYLTITKDWSDNSNQDGSRPKNVTFDIRGQAESSATTSSTRVYVYLDANGAVTASNLTNVTNEPVVTSPDSTDTSWGSFTIALPMYDAEGNAIQYYVSESAIDGYTAAYSQAGDFDHRVTLSMDENNPTSVTVTNTHTPVTYHVTYDGNNSTGGTVPEDNNTYTPADARVTVQGNTGSLTREGYTFLGWSTVKYPAITTQTDEDAITLYGNGDPLTITGNATLYAVWAVDANGNNTPDYEEPTVNLTFQWEDGSNRDGKRPDQVSVTLSNGKTYTAILTGENGNVLLKDGNTWVSEYLGEVTITSVTNPTDYTTEISADGTTVTLRYTPEKTSFTVTKNWEGMSAMPDSWRDVTATIKLYANGTEVAESERTVVYNGGTTVTWTDLNKNEKGSPIVYTAVETGITATVNGTENTPVADSFSTAYNSDTTIITNTLKTVDVEQTTSFTFVQKWDDDNDDAGMRPTSVTVQLVDEDGKNVGSSVTLDGSETTPWTCTWENLAAFKDSYRPTQAPTAEDYKSYSVDVTLNYAQTGFDGLYTTVTENYTNLRIDTSSLNTTKDEFFRTITVEKKWANDDAVTDQRPDAVSIQLKADGDVVQTASLYEGHWTATFRVPTYQDFKAITYSVTEFDPSPKYQVEVTSNGDAYTVTNTYNPDTYSLTYDANGGTGSVPVDETVYSEFNQKATVKDQPEDLKREDCTFLGWSTVSYPVISTADAYNQIQSGLLSANDPLTITGNTTLYAVWAVDENGDDTPDYNQDSVSLIFVWRDDDNRDGVRPDTLTVTLGDNTTATVTLGGNVVVSTGGNQWTSVEQYLPGTKIQSVTGTGVSETGETAYNYTINGTTVILTHTPETYTDEKPVTVTKNWSGLPDDWTDVQATIALYANGKQVGGTKTVMRTDTTASWSGEGIYVYENGKEITYTARETGITRSGTDVAAYFTVTGNGTLTITNTYSAGAYTVTYDGNGGTGSVPTDGNTYNAQNNKVTVLGNTEGLERDKAAFMGWSTEQYPLIETKQAWNLIADNVLSEGAKLTISGSTTLYAVWAIDENGSGKPDYNEDSARLTFIWDDDSNRDGIRPTEVEVELSDGETWIATLGEYGNVLLKDGDTWVSVPQYLTIESVTDLNGYTAKIGADGTTVTLTHEPELTDIEVTKVWANMDEIPDDWYGITATIVLYGNGQQIGKAQKVTYGDDNTVTWANVYKYENGQEIVYHAYESDVSMTGADDRISVAERFQVTYDFAHDEITNTFLVNTDAQVRAFTFVQEWDDSNDAAGMRPTSITVQLYDSDGNEVGEPVEITADDDWGCTWEDLPTFVSTDGDYQEYYAEVTDMEYADTDFDVDGLYIFAGSVTFGGSFINTQIDTLQIDADKLNRTITVEKEWVGDEKVPNQRPGEVAIQLLADGEVIRTVFLSEDNDWTADVTVPKYQDFEEIDYSVEEFEPSSKYVVSYEDFTVTNTLRQEISADDYTITFVYENAYAADGNGRIPEHTAITVPAGGTFTFTAYAEDGYTLLGNAEITDGAKMTNTGKDVYRVSNLTQDVTVTIKATPVVPKSGLSVTKTADKTSAKPGETITWTITVRNTGATTLQNITVTDALTAKGALKVVSMPEGVTNDGNGVFTIRTLAAESTAVILVSYTVLSTDEGAIVNTVKVTAGNPNDPDAPVDDEGKSTVIVDEPAGEPDLTVIKELSEVNGRAYKSGTVEVGDTLTYTITVRNTGSLPLYNIEVTDQLPDDVRFLTATKGYEYNERAGKVTWTIDSLDERETAAFTVEVRVLSDAEGTRLVNSADAVSDDRTGDSDSVTVRVDQESTPVTPSRPDPKPPVTPSTPDKPTLNTEDHVAYIIGYTDGTVRPLNEITRSEVATIFFRLLTDESRAYYWSQTNDYSDVDSGDWFNNAVSTLSNAGIITGYLDGTFRPNAYITRAEFAAIAARFSDVVYNGGNSFTDVPANHWAARYIALAEHLGWVNGYVDGTFRPDQNITRAEAMTLINRVLERAVDEDGLLPGMVIWSDNLPGAWYYEAVQEATNSHEYVRTGEQAPGHDFNYEDWQEIETVPDWAALEKAWSTVNRK